MPGPTAGEHATLSAAADECEALSAAAASAAAEAANAAAAQAAAAAAAKEKEKEHDAAGHAIGSEAAAWAELESLADMLLGAREAAIKTAAERDLLALQGVGANEVERSKRRAERRRRRADDLAVALEAARGRLAETHGWELLNYSSIPITSSNAFRPSFHMLNGVI